MGGENRKRPVEDRPTRPGEGPAVQESGPGPPGDLGLYLLDHYAINSLICQAATGADIDPDHISFLRP